MAPGPPIRARNRPWPVLNQGMIMLKRLCLALGLSVLSAPALAKDAELPMPLGDQLPVEILLTQHEIAVDVPEYSAGLAGQFGVVGALLGSMIENSESKKGENAVLPLRNMMVDYDFQQRLASALQAGLPDSGIATRPVVSISNLPWEGRADLQAMPPRALVIRPRYALDQTMSAMYVTLQVTLEDREARRGAVKRKIAFTRPYTFRTTLSNAVPMQTGPWTGLGAERLRQLMDQSVDQAVAILLYDFSAEGRQQWAQKVKGRTEIAGRNVPGRVERRNADAIWVRAGNRQMQNLTAYQTVRPGPAPAYQPAVHTPVAATTVATTDAGVVAAAELDVAPVDVVRAAPAVPVVPQAVPAAAAPVQVAVAPQAVQRAAPVAPAPAAPRSTFWEQYRPKESTSTPSTTP